MIELLVILFFIFIFTYVGYMSPTKFIILYLLSTTKFFGFLDLEGMSGALMGFNFFFFVLYLIAFCLAIIENNKIELRIDVKRIPIFLYFIIIFSHGILYPSIMGFSSVFPSIIAGKHFFIFFILLYMINKKSSIDFHLIKKTVIFLSIIISLIIFVYAITGITTPFYEQKTMLDGSPQGIIQVYFLTYISLSVFLLLREYMHDTKVKSQAIFLIIFFISILAISGHRSIFFTTLIFSLLFIFIKLFKRILTKINKPIIISSSIIIFLTFVGLFLSFYFQEINEIGGVVDPAIASRYIYDALRIDLISYRPFFGYGFIHPSSSIMSQLLIDFSSVYKETLTTVDSGYIDLMVRFGAIGTIFYLFPFAYISLKRIILNKKYNYSQILLAFFIAQYFAVNIVWSVFSYDHGLVTLVIAVFLLFFDDDMQEGVIKNETNNKLSFYVRPINIK